MKKNILIIGLFLAAVLLVSPAFAATLHVSPGAGHGHSPLYATIQAAVNAASPGDTIMVGPGNWAGATVNKKLTIEGKYGAVINSGPNPIMSSGPPPVYNTYIQEGFHLAAGSDGTKISDLMFENVTRGVAGDHVNNVTVTQCTFSSVGNSIYSVSGSFWQITHNEITDPKIIADPNMFPLGVAGGWAVELLPVDPNDRITGNVIAYNSITGMCVNLLGNAYSCADPYAGQSGCNRTGHFPVFIGIMLVVSHPPIPPNGPLPDYGIAHNFIFANHVDLQYEHTVFGLGLWDGRCPTSTAHPLVKTPILDALGNLIVAVYANGVMFNDFHIPITNDATTDSFSRPIYSPVTGLLDKNLFGGNRGVDALSCGDEGGNCFTLDGCEYHGDEGGN